MIRLYSLFFECKGAKTFRNVIRTHPSSHLSDTMRISKQYTDEVMATTQTKKTPMYEKYMMNDCYIYFIISLYMTCKLNILLNKYGSNTKKVESSPFLSGGLTHNDKWSHQHQHQQ